MMKSSVGWVIDPTIVLTPIFFVGSMTQPTKTWYLPHRQASKIYHSMTPGYRLND